MKNLLKILPLLSLASLLALPAAAQVGEPIPGLTADELALFNEGKAVFEKEFTALEGVGPLYNRRSCVACHGGPATGGADPNGTDGNANHIFIRAESSVWIPGHEFGGPVAQQLTTAGDPGVEDCTLPAENPAVTAFIPNAHVSTRHTPPVFGFGLIDAVSDKRIFAYAGKKPWKKSDKVVGIPNWGREMQGLAGAQQITLDPIPRTTPIGPSRIGRFGWKSQTATLFQFSAEPFNVELGVTSPFFARENEPTITTDPFNPIMTPDCDPIPGPDDADGTLSAKLYYFQAFTAPPVRGEVGPREQVGEMVFASIGCTDCHRKQMKTGHYYVPWPDGTAHKVDALSNKVFNPYSDLLVHDLGEANDDKRQMGGASGRFWRTTPLWGIRHKTNFWHDGASTSVEHAIYRHGGEGADSVDEWDALSPFLKGLVLDFLASL